MSEVAELFNELLFGSAWLLGFILIVSLVLVVTARVKYSSLVFFPVLALLGMMYLDNISETNYFMYSALITWAIIPLILFIEAKRGK